MTRSREKVVLITGASTGIGRVTADRLAEAGFNVFGTSRRPGEHAAPEGWDLLQLDVRSDDSVARCVKDVVDRTGRIDALVNNAGFGLGGAAEEATPEQVRAEFETNVFGLFRMTRAVLPDMRRRGKGAIINISSGNAAVRLPFSSHYVASKCAVEGLSACLRQELKPLGIHVSVIEPTFLKSNIADTIEMGEEKIDDYEPWATAWEETMRRSVQTGADPGPVAECVVRILASRRPRYLYVVGPDLRLARWAKQFLPEELFYWGIRRALRVKPNGHRPRE
jgi:NAD(P)-dependent dehydrogenase (short-subunit alcohol dehydrogenase family)